MKTAPFLHQQQRNATKDGGICFGYLEACCMDKEEQRANQILSFKGESYRVSTVDMHTELRNSGKAVLHFLGFSSFPPVPSHWLC